VGHRPEEATAMSDVTMRATCLLLLVAGLTACGGLTAQQDVSWTAFHECRASAPSAVLEDLSPGGRVNYRTQEGGEWGAMKSCMERRGFACDLGPSFSARLYTLCRPGTS
jgi:hypothetical protein